MSPLGVRLEGLYKNFDAEELLAVDRELRRLSDSLSLDHLVEMWKAVCLHTLKGVAGNGLPLASKAIRCARKSGDLATLRRLLNTRGEVHRVSGDLAHALEDYIEAYEVAVMLGGTVEKVATLSNLATVPLELGLVDISERVLVHALYLLQDCDESDPRAVLSRAMVLANLGGALVWSDPLKSSHMSDQALRVTTRISTSSGLLGLHARDLEVRTRINKLIAFLQLGDLECCKAAANELRAGAAAPENAEVGLCLQTALAAFEARLGDRVLGTIRLREAVACERRSFGDWMEGVKLLVQTLELSGHEREAIDALSQMYKRVQSIRRGIAVEELRRIDVDLPVETAERIFDRELAQFAILSEELSFRLSAKLQHLERLAVTAELREGSETNRAEHIYRVGRLCVNLAAAAGCGAELQWLAEVAGRLHDIGKCAIPDDALLGTAGNRAQGAIIREHAEYGARLVADADEPRLVQVVAAVRHHHEKFDGGGYPTGLGGEEIPLLARIVAIAESFDAMLQSRAFRNRRSVTGALEEIERCAGTQFDLRLAGLFVSLVRRLVREHGDIQEYLGRQARAVSSVRAFSRLELLGADARRSM
jgi:putative two-component system response regulator